MESILCREALIHKCNINYAPVNIIFFSHREIETLVISREASVEKNCHFEGAKKSGTLPKKFSLDNTR